MFLCWYFLLDLVFCGLLGKIFGSFEKVGWCFSSWSFLGRFLDFFFSETLSLPM